MATVEDKKVTLSPEVVALAAEIKAAIPDFEVKGDEASAVLPKESYVKAMKDAGIEEETLNTISKVQTTFFAAAALAGGEKANELIAKNKSVNSADLTVKLTGRDAFNANIKRSVESGAPGSDVKTTSYGVMSASVKVFPARHQTGVMSDVRTHLKAQAADLYSK